MRSRAQLDDRSSAAPRGPLYDQDFALWIAEQVAALRAGDAAALDVHNLIEELEGLTKPDERALGSQLKRIMVHLLKRRHQPQRASRSWVGLDREWTGGNRRHPGAEPQPPSRFAGPVEQELSARRGPGRAGHATACTDLPDRAAVHA